MRLFVALGMSREVGDRLAALVDELRRADAAQRWVNPRNLHVTLKFIGHVRAERLADVSEALARVRRPEAVDLEFRDIGFFPDERRPSIVWVGILAGPGLAQLAGEVDRAVAACGIPPEGRPFVPHLTVGRLRETRLPERLREEIGRSKGRSFGHFRAGEFHLMESKLKSTGAEYTTLQSFRFTEQRAER
jgi:RNA 2',3'-cyclic 3'-phosphodiesterase